MNVFSNFIPNSQWMNEFVKNKIMWKNEIYKACKKWFY